jgi:predicted nuclease with TOPRIM domain
MPIIQDFEGAGRVRLSNGARMSYTGFKQAMKEMFPDNQETKKPLDETNDAYDYLDEVIEDVKRLETKLSRLEKSVYLRRAEKDIASGRTRNETEPTVTHHSSEVDIWK